MRRRDLLSLTGRAVVAMPLLHGATPVSDVLEKAIVDCREQIPIAMKELLVPGVTVALIKNAKVQWSGAFGVADVLTREPVTDDTIFQAGSMSKPVFAYAVMKLVERGVLQLDTPLTKYTRKRFIADDPQLALVGESSPNRLCSGPEISLLRRGLLLPADNRHRVDRPGRSLNVSRWV